MTYAPGIPKKGFKPPIREITKPETGWHFAVQEHKAKRAGLHYDWRIGDPKSAHGHSWATKHLPEPGKPVLAVRQPNHDLAYFDFEGSLPAGYGEGEVKLQKRSNIDVLEANDNFVRFNAHNGRVTEEYALVHTSEGDNWLLVKKKPYVIPTDVSKLKVKTQKDLDLKDTSKVLTAKIDGAHSTVFMKPSKQIRVFSHRESKRDAAPIEYTHKIPDLIGRKASKEIGDTELRGEVYVESKKGPAPVRITSGILNALVENSRELQKKHGPLKIALFDVKRYKGKPAADLDYHQKLPILEQAVKEHPDVFRLPERAITQEEKLHLLYRIKTRQHPQTDEGVVEWGKTPAKIKFGNQSDVWVVGVTKGTGKYSKAGGALVYSHTKNGKPAGKLGTGFSDADRSDMADNPYNWVGKKIVVKHSGKMPSGALFQPSFSGFHLS